MPINLLPQKKTSFAEKFFSWALTFGRFIIIGVELVVLLAFASRFKLDRDLVDLHDKIKQEESITKSLSGIETKSRSLQKRLFEISSVNENVQNSLGVLLEIPSLVPTNVFLDGLVIQEKSLKIDGRTFSGDGVSTFIKRLRANNRISSISLDNVTRDETLGGQIKFTVTATLTYADTSK